MKLFFVPTSVTKYDPTKSKLSFTTFILMGILIILPFNIISFWITKVFGYVFRRCNMHDALSHTKMFSFLGLKETGESILTIFIQGLIMSIVYAAVMIPTVDLNGYCANTAGNITNTSNAPNTCACALDTATQQKIQQDFELFGNRFRVGYYIIMVLVIFIFLYEYK